MGKRFRSLVVNTIEDDVEGDDGGVDNGGDVGTDDAFATAVQVLCTAKCIRPREQSVLKAVVQVCMDR